MNGEAISGASSPIYIVDSGTTLNYLPTTMANAVNKAFVPAAVYSSDEGAYVVSCTATPPVFGIEIGGTIFYTNPLDMMMMEMMFVLVVSMMVEVILLRISISWAVHSRRVSLLFSMLGLVCCNSLLGKITLVMTLTKRSKGGRSQERGCGFQNGRRFQCRYLNCEENMFEI